MKRYFSGFETNIRDKYPEPPYISKGIRFIFDDLRPKGSRSKPFKTNIFEDGRTVPSKFIIIEVRDKKTAEKAFNLIDSSQVVIDAFKFFDHSELLFSMWEINDQFKVDYNTPSTYKENYQLAALMASRALARGGKYINSLEKLNLSFELINVAPIDIDPYHSENIPKPTLNKNCSPRELIRLTEALNLAYSAIEEMGVERPRPSKNSEFVRKDGVWNEKLKTKMLQRLKKINISPDDTIIWNLRGPKTYIEKSYESKGVASLPWNNKDVRDQEILVIDALIEAYFLRNKVSSHSLSTGSEKDKSKKVKTLSVYDVINVQYLSRLLILKALKIYPLMAPV